MSPRNCLPSNVDHVRGSICGRPGASGVAAERGHAQHAPARGDELTGTGSRPVPAWVTNTPAGTSSRSGDHVAARRRRGIARAGEDDRHRDVAGPTRSSATLEPPGAIAAASSPSRSERSRGRIACVSGSPKRTLNSSTLNPGRAHHQPRVQDAVERRSDGARARRAPAGGLRAQISAARASSTAGTGEYEPMPPVFGPSSSSKIRL